MTRGHARVLKPLDWLGIAATYCSLVELHWSGRFFGRRDFATSPEEKVEVRDQRARLADRIDG